MNEKLNGNYLNGSLNMEDQQEVNGCHCERSVAISYGKNVLAGFYEIPSLCSEQARKSYNRVIASEAWQSPMKRMSLRGEK